MQIIENILITAVVVIGGIWLIRAFFWHGISTWVSGPSDSDSSDSGLWRFSSSDSSDCGDSGDSGGSCSSD